MTESNAVANELRGMSEPPAANLPISSARQEFVVNVGSNIAFMALQTLITLWFTPYLIRYLGIAAYGMLPLMNTILSYLDVLTSSLNSAFSRFLQIDLGRGDRLTANKTFNTALFGVAGFAAVLTPIMLLIALAFPRVFNVPDGWEKDASVLFTMLAVSLFIGAVESCFGVSSYAHSKFLWRNLVETVALFARVGLVVVLFFFLPARLWQVGGGVLVATLITLLGHVYLWRKLTPQLHIQLQAFDRSRLRSIMGMGGWVVIDRVGSVLLKRVDLIVVNLLFGAAMTGRYGAILLFSSLITTLATNASTVVNPVIMKRYAQGNLVGLQHLSSQAVKLLGLMLALPIGLLCGFSRPLLSIWLGPSFKTLDLLLVIMVAHLALNLGATPLGYVQGALNRVRWPGIATLIAGGVNLGLAFVFAKWLGWGAIGVALAGATVWTTKNTLFFPLYTAYILRASWWTFLPSLGAGVLGTICVALLAYGTTLVWMPGSWFTLGLAASLVSLSYIAGVYLIGLNLADKKLIASFMPGR